MWQGLTGILEEQANCILTPTAYKIMSFTKTNAVFQINKRKAACLFNSLHPVVTIFTTSLTFNNSTFCPHSVFMCFMWISEQTAIISLYSTDWLVFITETQCVYCAVRSTFYVLPTQCIYVFCVDVRTNSDYFTIQH